MLTHCFKYLYTILVLTSAFVLHSGSAGAQTKWWFEEPHVTSPDNSTECLKCHLADSQGGYDIYGLLPLPRGAEQEALCRTCHNPTGTASDKSDVGNHTVSHGGDNMTIDCSTCHDPHAFQESTDPHTGVTAENLNLVRSTISAELVPDVLNPLIFQEKPAHFAFDEGNSPYIGVCQSCHTETNYHRNDVSTYHDHQTGTICTTCHSHSSGFVHGGGAGTGCEACHGKDADNGGAGTTQSHSTHTENDTDDLRGPFITCSACHDTNNFPYFKTGNDISGDGKIDLEETDVL